MVLETAMVLNHPFIACLGSITKVYLISIKDDRHLRFDAGSNTAVNSFSVSTI